MNMRNLLPYLFLLVLVIILVFVGGIRYGRNVEQANKAVNYVLSLPPTQPPTTPAPQTVGFYQVESKLCGIKFLLPSTLAKDKVSSLSGIFVEKTSKTASFSFSCEPKNGILAMLESNKLATAEISFQTANIKAKTDPKKTILYFQTINRLNGKQLFFSLEKHLLPLLDSSLTFTR